MRLVLDYGGTVVEHVDESEYSRVLADDPVVPDGGYIAYKAFSLGILDTEEEYIATLATLTGSSPERCRAYLAERKHAAELPDGRDELLHELAEHHSLVLFTDQVRPWVEEALEARGIRSCFDDLVVSSELGHEKPHPAGYLEAVGDADPASTLMVSDELNADLLMADHLGLTTVWIENDHEPVHAEPDHRLEALEDLPPLLERIDGPGAP